MTKVLFLSDMHLGAAYVSEADARARERRVTDVLRRHGSDATHIYLLGDVLDYWYEYRNVVPRGHVRFFGELARLSDSGVPVTWITGNHDIWLFDYLRDELGIEVVDEPYIEREIAGKKFLLAHGDRIGPSSAGFRFICSLFRNKVCQKLYASLHPRLTVPFALRWSGHSRGSEACETEAQRAEHRKCLVQMASDLKEKHPATDFFIMGHHHMPMQCRAGDADALLTVLGDWSAGESFAVYDGENLLLHPLVHIV